MKIIKNETIHSDAVLLELAEEASNGMPTNNLVLYFNKLDRTKPWGTYGGLKWSVRWLTWLIKCDIQVYVQDLEQIFATLAHEFGHHKQWLEKSDRGKTMGEIELEAEQFANERVVERRRRKLFSRGK